MCPDQNDRKRGLFAAALRGAVLVPVFICAPARLAAESVDTCGLRGDRLPLVGGIAHLLDLFRVRRYPRAGKVADLGTDEGDVSVTGAVHHWCHQAKDQRPERRLHSGGL
jgi:hypothetical protein